MSFKAFTEQFSTTIKPALVLNKIASRTLQQITEQNLGIIQNAIYESSKCFEEIPNAKDNAFLAYGKMLNDFNKNVVENAKKSIEPFFATTAQFNKIFEDNIATASNMAFAAANTVTGSKKSTETTK